MSKMKYTTPFGDRPLNESDVMFLNGYMAGVEDCNHLALFEETRKLAQQKDLPLFFYYIQYTYPSKVAAFVTETGDLYKTYAIDHEVSYNEFYDFCRSIIKEWINDK
ncbi:MAG: hypothetical protein IKF29_00445 [Oceanobacillus sp.]|nr:hypothetical protein [Oceanobacillus sp.]